MAEGRRNLLVGVFVLVGLTTLGSLIVLFGRGPTWLVRGDTYPVHVRFVEVAGIRPGTLVTVKGITIGRVDSVDLVTHGEPTAAAPETEDRVVGEDTGVDVLLAIESRYLVPEDSSARTTEPVLGQGRPPIEIDPGTSTETLVPGAVIPGEVQKAIDTIFPRGVVNTVETTARQIGDAAEALTPVLEEARAILERRAPREVDLPGGRQGNLSSAVARLDASLKHFNEVLGDPAVKSQLRDTVANVRDMSEKGKKVMADLETAAGEAREVVADARKFVTKADETLTNMDGRVTELARATRESLEKADRFLDHLNIIGQQITRGEGNIGGLVMDSKLYEAMVITAERLSLAVEEFRGLIEEWRQGKIRVAL